MQAYTQRERAECMLALGPTQLPADVVQHIAEFRSGSKAYWRDHFDVFQKKFKPVLKELDEKFHAFVVEFDIYIHNSRVMLYNQVDNYYLELGDIEEVLEL